MASSEDKLKGVLAGAGATAGGAVGTMAAGSISLPASSIFATNVAPVAVALGVASAPALGVILTVGGAAAGAVAAYKIAQKVLKDE